MADLCRCECTRRGRASCAGACTRTGGVTRAEEPESGGPCSHGCRVAAGNRRGRQRSPCEPAHAGKVSPPRVGPSMPWIPGSSAWLRPFLEQRTFVGNICCKLGWQGFPLVLACHLVRSRILLTFHLLSHLCCRVGNKRRAAAKSLHNAVVKHMEHIMSCRPITLASHVALLTAVYPVEHSHASSWWAGVRTCPAVLSTYSGS